MSLNPGTQQYGETKTGIHVTMSTTGTVKTNQPVVSITQDPMTPVEYGRVAAGSKYTVTASSGAEIPDQTPAPSLYFLWLLLLATVLPRPNVAMTLLVSMLCSVLWSTVRLKICVMRITTAPPLVEMCLMVLLPTMLG